MALTSVSATIGNMASFSLSQVMLQLTNSWLDVFGQTLRVAGVKEENMLRKKVMKMHSTTKTILKMGKEKAGEDIEKKIETVSFFGIILMVVIVMGVVRQLLLLMIVKIVESVRTLKTWIVLNKVELTLAVLLVMNVILLAERVLDKK